MEINKILEASWKVVEVNSFKNEQKIMEINKIIKTHGKLMESIFLVMFSLFNFF